MTMEDYWDADGPPHERAIFDVVAAFVVTLGPVHIEPVSVGLFFKRPEKFAELRPMTKWSALSFSLGRRVSHRCITRKPFEQGSRWFYVANLHTPEDFDDDLRAWIAEAYESAR